MLSLELGRVREKLGRVWERLDRVLERLDRWAGQGDFINTDMTH